MSQPLAIDLFCGLGGWTEGLLAEGYYVVGFDIERHQYGDAKYPAQMVIQDVLTLHGSQFKDAALIVASPPCQEFSYMAMPWTLAKEKQARILADPAEQKRLTALFDACFRIQREASEEAGRYIPLVVENVKGAQKWVGRARWNYGSFYLWGDVPALMPIVRRAQKFNPDGTAHPSGSWFAIADSKNRGERSTKNSGGSWFAIGSPGQKETGRNPVHNFKVSEDGVKGFTPHGQPLGKNELGRKFGSKSKARKAASAAIAKIPFALAQLHRAGVEASRTCSMKPCLKQLTHCRIVRADGRTYEATNQCAVDGLAVCPRVTAGCPTGEGYELCGSTHAEANVAALAMGSADVPGEAFLSGHTWMCKACQDALRAVNVHTFHIAR